MTNKWLNEHMASLNLQLEALNEDAKGHHNIAKKYYLQAADLELLAYKYAPKEKESVRAILIVSAIYIFYQGGDINSASKLAKRYLTKNIPNFAKEQLQGILHSIYGEK